MFEEGLTTDSEPESTCHMLGIEICMALLEC